MNKWFLKEHCFTTFCKNYCNHITSPFLFFFNSFYASTLRHTCLPCFLMFLFYHWLLILFLMAFTHRLRDFQNLFFRVLNWLLKIGPPIRSTFRANSQARTWENVWLNDVHILLISLLDVLTCTGRSNYVISDLLYFKNSNHKNIYSKKMYPIIASSE